jgi:hypothetical protein
MKICPNCGFVDLKPEVKCPKCKNKYGDSYSCNPLSGMSKDNFGYEVGEGNYYTKPPQYDKDEK